MMCIIFLYDCFRALLTPNVSVVSLVVVYACVRMSATLAERCSSTLLLLILQSCNSVISTHGRRELMRQEAFVTVVDAKTTTTTMSRIHKRKKKLKRCCHHCYSRQNSFRTSPESPSESMISHHRRRFIFNWRRWWWCLCVLNRPWSGVAIVNPRLCEHAFHQDDVKILQFIFRYTFMDNNILDAHHVWKLPII